MYKKTFKAHDRRERNQQCHCDEYLSRSAFWKHRKLFYDLKTGTWTTKTSIQSKKRQAKVSKGDSTMNQSTQSFESIFAEHIDIDNAACITSSDDNSDFEQDIIGKFDPFLFVVL